MGKSSGGGQGTPGTQTVVNQSQPPQAFLNAYTNLTNAAQAQSAQPLQQYTGPLVQGFTPQQLQAFGTTQNIQGQYAPYLNAAGTEFTNATQQLWPSLPTFNTAGLPSAGIGALTAGQQYAANAAQPIDVSPYTGLATQAALGLGAAAPQYANTALSAAGNTDVSPYQNFATQTAAGLGAAAPQYANIATQSAAGMNPAPYENFAAQAAAGLGAAAPQYANIATTAATGLNAAPYQNLATQPLTTQGYGSLGEYLSPYTSDVTGSLQQLLNQQNATQQSQTQGNAAAQGALGGDRSAVAAALTAQGQQLAETPQLAQVLQQGFQGAQSELNAQQQLQLQQGVSQGQLGLGAGQLGTTAAQTQGQLGLGAGQLINTAAGTEGQLGLGAGQLGIQGGTAAGQLGLGAGQLVNQAAGTEIQGGLGAGQLGLQAGLGQAQVGLGAGQLVNQAAGTEGQLGLGAAGATTQALGTQGQLQLGAGQLTGQMGQGLLSEFNQQQQTQEAAEQANAWLASQAGFGMANLGQEEQSLGLAGAGAEQQTGALQQAVGQEQLNIPYEQFIQQQAYPYGQLNFLAPIVEGTGSLSGGTAATTSPGPSAISQVAGLGLAGLGTAGLLNATGAFGSTGWLTGAGGLFGSSVAAAPPALDALSSAALAAPATDVGTGLLSTLGADAAFVERGGRIGRQTGGPVPVQPGAGLGLSAPMGIDLSWLSLGQGQGLGHGSGPPKAPQESQQPPGLDLSQITKDLSSAETMIKLGELGSPTHTHTQGEAFGGGVHPPGLSRGFHPHTSLPHIGAAPHLGASGFGMTNRYPGLGRRYQDGGDVPADTAYDDYIRVLEGQPLRTGGRARFQSGGELPLAAAAPLSGISPNVQGMYQQFTQMSEEQLRELALRVPSSTSTGQMIQRALQAKMMTPQVSPTNFSVTGAAPMAQQPTAPASGMRSGGRLGLQTGGPLGVQLPSSTVSEPGGLVAGGATPPINLGGAASAPRFQPPIGLYSPSLVQGTDALAGLTKPTANLPTTAPAAQGPGNIQQPTVNFPTSYPLAQNALAGVPAPNPQLPTGTSQGGWPTGQYTPVSSERWDNLNIGNALPSQYLNPTSVSAPTVNPNIFTSYGAFGQATPGSFSYYGADIPNAAITDFAPPQLGIAPPRNTGIAYRGGAIRPHRQAGGDADDTPPPATGGVVRDPKSTTLPYLGSDTTPSPFVQRMIAGFKGEKPPANYTPGSPADPDLTFRQRFNVPAQGIGAPAATPAPQHLISPKSADVHEGLSRPVLADVDLNAAARSVAIPLGEGLGAAAQPASSSQPQTPYDRAVATDEAKRGPMVPGPAATASPAAAAPPAAAPSAAAPQGGDQVLPRQKMGPVAQGITELATKYGVSAPLALKTAQIESGMGTNLGSLGNIYQLNKQNWQDMGGGDMRDPSAQIDHGLKYLAQMQTAAQKTLGRTPEDWETYLFHQQGEGGAPALLRAPQGMSAVDALTPAYQGNRAMAMKAIVGNGGNLGMTAQQFADLQHQRFEGFGSRLNLGAQLASGSTATPEEGGPDQLLRNVGFRYAPGSAPPEANATPAATPARYEREPTAPHGGANQIMSSPWMIPLTVGAGMLASRSPWPGQALGEGLLTGTKFLSGQQTQQYHEELADARAKYQDSLASVRQQSADQQAKHMADWMEKARLDDQRRGENLQLREDNLVHKALEEKAKRDQQQQLIDFKTAATTAGYDINPATGEYITGSLVPDPEQHYKRVFVPGPGTGAAPRATTFQSMEEAIKIAHPDYTPQQVAQRMLDMKSGKAGSELKPSEYAHLVQQEVNRASSMSANPNANFRPAAEKAIQRTLGLSGPPGAPTAAATQAATPAPAAASPTQAPTSNQPAEVIQNGWRYQLKNGQYTPVGPVQP